MTSRVLDPEAIRQFVRDGYVHVRNAMPKETAAAIVDRLWEVLDRDHGVKRDAPLTWRKPVVHIQESYDGPPFAAGWTPRLRDAIGDLVGDGRSLARTTLGWWPVAFPGFDAKPWRPPENGWHVDGIQFHHHIDSPDQGLLCILIMTDIGPGDGGTVLVPGSHRVTARILAEAEPNGLDCQTLCERAVAETPRDRVVEAQGEAGDAILLHPFMLHSRSANTGPRVRFICNPCISLNAPMTLDPAAPGERSPVETAIISALNPSPYA
jgi:hypothetical protein